MEEKINKLILKALEVAEQTGNFIIDQAPDILQEFYRWHTYKFIFWIILLTLVGSFLTKPVIKSWKALIEDDDDLPNILIAVFGTLTVVTCLGFIVSNLYNLIFILTAPKLYIIEYFLN